MRAICGRGPGAPSCALLACALLRLGLCFIDNPWCFVEAVLYQRQRLYNAKCAGSGTRAAKCQCWAALQEEGDQSILGCANALFAGCRLAARILRGSTIIR